MLDESDWHNIDKIEDFIQVEPNYGSMPSKKTEVKILYDNKSLYIAVHLHDKPENIKKKSAVYDDWYEGFENNSDYFVLEIDSEHNHQQSYCFAVNSMGIQADYTMYEDGYVDDDWNSVHWNVKTNIIDDGWVIEYEIPFKILKYHSNKSLGINLIRFSHSDKELSYWSLLPIEIDGTVSHYGHINNLELPNLNNFKFNPYIVNGKTKFNNKYYGLSDNGSIDYDLLMIEKVPNDINRLGFDMSYAIDNSLFLSYTYNPDFGQIEQNASDINFTSYEDFYTEKRPFFINNNHIFFTPINIFYSQRIGGNIIYDNQLYNVAIEDAFRFDGSNDNNFNYGFLFARSKIDDKDNIFNDRKINTFVSRLKKNIINDNSYLGFMNTTHENSENLSQVYAIDGAFSLFSNKLKIDGQIASSDNDSAINNGIGQSYEISYKNIILNDRYSFFYNNIFNFWFNFQKYDKDFYINDMGYLPRNDYVLFNSGLAFTKNNPNNFSIYRMFHFQTDIAKNIDGDRLRYLFTSTWQNTFINNFLVSINYIKALSHYDDWLFLDYDYNYFINNNSPIVKKPGSDELQINFQTDPTHHIFLDYSLAYFNNDINDSGISYYINLNYKPIDWLSIDFDYKIDDYSDKYNLLKIRRYYPLDLGNSIRNDEYLFSDSDILKKQFTLSVFTYFTKRFSLELFSRYFIYDNDFSSSINYYKMSQNYIYPDIPEEIGDDFDNDRLLYGANYSSLEFNCIFKFEFDRKMNLYIIYSLFKGVNGIEFSDLFKFLDYEHNSGDINPAEVFYDKSIFVKFDFLLNN